jgi:hypothetical protein
VSTALGESKRALLVALPREVHSQFCLFVLFKALTKAVLPRLQTNLPRNYAVDYLTSSTLEIAHALINMYKGLAKVTLEKIEHHI